MSTCPSKDIHSIYLDNELPAAYIPEYEAHIKSCPKCAAELAKLKAVRSLFIADSKALTPDSHYLDQSWERLQSRMSYSKVTKKIYRFPSEQVRYIIPAAAAAAILAIVLPVRAFRSQGSAPAAQLTPITRSKKVNLAKNNIVINGTIGHQMLDPAPLRTGQQSQSVLLGLNAGYGSSFMHGQTAVQGSIDPALNDVDVFRPDFDDKQTITIRITMPGITTPPVSAEIELPSDQIADIVK